MGGAGLRASGIPGPLGPAGEGTPRRSMHPPPPDAGVAMDFGQNSLFGYMEDLQELTIIERPVRRSLKVRGTERRSPQGCPPDPAASDCPSALQRQSPCHRSRFRASFPAAAEGRPVPDP